MGVLGWALVGAGEGSGKGPGVGLGGVCGIWSCGLLEGERSLKEVREEVREGSGDVLRRQSKISPWKGGDPCRSEKSAPKSVSEPFWQRKIFGCSFLKIDLGRFGVSYSRIGPRKRRGPLPERKQCPKTLLRLIFEKRH